MKTTSFIAILLTFLTMLLVLAASVLFLWQGRQEDVAEIDQLELEQAALQGTATVVRSYLAAREEGLATAKAGGTEVAQALGQAEATAAALAGTRASVAAERAALETRAAEQESVLMRPPSVAILAPGPEAPAGSASQVVVAGSHPLGIESVRLDAGDVQTAFAGNGEPFQVFSYTLPGPLAPGIYTVTATLTATNLLTATDQATFRVLPGPASGDPESGLRLPAAASLYPVFFKPAAMPLMVRKIARSSARASSPS